MGNMDAAHIEVRTEGRVRTLVIDRPEKKNAVSVEMYRRLTAELDRAAEDPAIRVVVVTGSGDVFTSGNDVADFPSVAEAGEEAPVFRFIEALPKFPKPLVAAVNGLAVGIGTTMLLHCDLVYASSEAVFSVPFTRLGLTPEAASSLLLPYSAGLQRATELLMFGEPFDAERALEAGLVNEILPPEAVAPRAAERAADLARLPPAAIRRTKALIRRGLPGDLNEVMRREAIVFRKGLASPESAEAFAAFFEKRTPDFSDFE